MKKAANQAGFSLIELLVVIAIILIISAIAIPALLRARMGANEASAVQTLRTINTSSLQYYTRCGGYADALTKMGPGTPATCTAADLLDAVVVAGAKSGYNFVYAGTAGSYTVTANAAVQGGSGERHFFTDQSGVIRFDDAGAATVSSPPLN